MPWHFAEQLACVRWARPERTFCTRAHRVAASHCRRPALVLALPHSQPTRPDSSLAAEPLLELHSATTASRHRRSDSLCHGRRRPSHNSSPAALVSRPSLSPSPSASTDPAPAIATSPCRNRSGRPAILSPAAAEPTFPGYKWPQASLEHPQASHRVHPLAQILLKPPSSPPPATSAVAVPQLNSP